MVAKPREQLVALGAALKVKRGEIARICLKSRAMSGRTKTRIALMRQKFSTVIARRASPDEAIQGSADGLDCFASLAMTMMSALCAKASIDSAPG
jgi:hypothetical protein